MQQIIGLGGGGFSMEESPLLDLYILASAKKSKPNICFLPTASADNSGYTQHFISVFEQYPCVPKFLNLFSPTTKDIEDILLSSDIVYVGGGNSKSMLAIWREWGVDKILQKAYHNGTVLSGVSAGFVCWFEQCVTDSIPQKYSVLDCLGLLEGSGCPHYSNEKGRPPAFQRLLSRNKIKPGYAADNSVGLHFIDGKLIRTISSAQNAKAYQLYKDNDTIIEKPIEPICLDNPEHIQTYIEPLFKHN